MSNCPLGFAKFLGCREDISGQEVGLDVATSCLIACFLSVSIRVPCNSLGTTSNRQPICVCCVCLHKNVDATDKHDFHFNFHI